MQKTLTKKIKINKLYKFFFIPIDNKIFATSFSSTNKKITKHFILYSPNEILTKKIITQNILLIKETINVNN